GDKPKLKYMKGPKCENTGTISSTVTNAFDIRTSLTRTSKIRNLKLSRRANRENLAIVSTPSLCPQTLIKKHLMFENKKCCISIMKHINSEKNKGSNTKNIYTTKTTNLRLGTHKTLYIIDLNIENIDVILLATAEQ
ncbi:hypothetical protein CDIK_4523, partial [Cucumispora dikerogammari]